MRKAGKKGRRKDKGKAKGGIEGRKEGKWRKQEENIRGERDKKER